MYFKVAICLIIDLEVFFIQKQFYCGELGRANNQGTYGYVHYQQNFRREDLTCKEQKTAKFVINKIHELPFNNQASKIASPLTRLKEHVQELYENAKTPEKWMVADKRGHLERDLLKQLNIPAVNLEDLGYPAINRTAWH